MTHTALTLKHWLVPHHGNKHQPRLLSTSSLVLIALVLIAVQLAYNFTVSGKWQVLGFATNISQTALVDITNHERMKAGLSPLRSSSALDNAARLKAEHMFKHNYWAHVAPDGTQPWAFIKSAGYIYLYAGENLARDFDTSAGVVAGWMASPGHKANILNENYTEIGIAAVNGQLLGEETTLVVAFYSQPVTAQVTLNQLTPSSSGQNNSASTNQPAQPVPSVSSSQAETEELRVTGQESLADKNTPASNLATYQPLLLTGSLGWGPLFTLGTVGTLLPVYVATHVNMVRQKMHKAAKWLWRRRLLELGILISLIASLLLRGLGTIH